jgi:hypothetical protein
MMMLNTAVISVLRILVNELDNHVLDLLSRNSAVLTLPSPSMDHVTGSADGGGTDTYAELGGALMAHPGTLAKTVDQLHQHYKCSGCNPGKCPDTRRMVFASRTGNRDIAHDRYLCISL